MRVGIDFGTTNSAVALSDGARVHTFRVDAELPDLLPSLIYITKDFEEYAGSAAREIYLKKNTNRPSRFRPVTVGEITLTVGGASGVKFITQDVIVMIDILSPGRLIRSVKTGLRNDEYKSTSIFGEEYTLEQLISIILREMVQNVAHQTGRPVKQIVLGRPVKFSEDPVVDEQAEARLRLAASLAGIDDVTFLPEPIAAAYAYHRDFDAPRRTFIFDFGGGTLDLTVAELGGDGRPRILSTAGVLIGGDDFDRRLMQHLLPHFGQGETLAGNMPVPEHIWQAMGDWQTVEDLKRSDSIKVIEDAARPGGSSRPEAFEALHALVTNNLYYKLLRAVEETKIALSRETQTTLHFHEDGIDIAQPITRLQFENMIRTEVSRIDAAIAATVAQAGLTPADIEFVVTTGGSSQIPIFRRLLADTFVNAAAADKASRVLTGVTQGLAVYGFDLDSAESTPTAQRTTLIETLHSAEYEPPPKRNRSPYAHYVVGLDKKMRLQVHPWRTGQTSADLAALNRSALVRGVFATRTADILVGTTLNRFFIADLTALHDASVEHEKTPHQFKLDHLKGEQLTLLQRWGGFGSAAYVLLLTRWGNVRLFPTRLVMEPLSDMKQWWLDMRGNMPDPPAALLGVARRQQVIVAAASGRAIRMAVSDMSVRGGRGLRLKSAESVYALPVTAGDDALFVTQDGMAQRISSKNIPVAKKTGGTGKLLLRTGTVCAVLPCAERQQARGLTSLGRLVELDLASAIQRRDSERVVQLAKNEHLIAAWQ